MLYLRHPIKPYTRNPLAGDKVGLGTSKLPRYVSQLRSGRGSQGWWETVVDHKVQKRKFPKQDREPPALTPTHSRPEWSSAASVEVTIQSREHGVRVIIPRHDALAQ